MKKLEFTSIKYMEWSLPELVVDRVGTGPSAQAALTPLFCSPHCRNRPGLCPAPPPPPPPRLLRAHWWGRPVRKSEPFAFLLDELLLSQAMASKSPALASVPGPLSVPPSFPTPVVDFEMARNSPPRCPAPRIRSQLLSPRRSHVLTW